MLTLFKKKKKLFPIQSKLFRVCQGDRLGETEGNSGGNASMGLVLEQEFQKQLYYEQLFKPWYLNKVIIFK